MKQIHKVKIAARTVRGKRRARNEDAIVIKNWYSSPEDNNMSGTSFRTDTPLLLAVADGVGGHAAGDVASQYITRHLAQVNWGENFESEIILALNKFHRELENLGNNLPDLKGMGTTVAGVIIHNSTLHYFNIGDSRVYLLSDQSITQLKARLRTELRHQRGELSAHDIKQADQAIAKQYLKHFAEKNHRNTSTR